MFCPLWIDTINKPHTQRQIWQPATYQGDQSKSVLHFVPTEGSLAVLSIGIYFITDAITNTYLVLFQFPEQGAVLQWKCSLAIFGSAQFRIFIFSLSPYFL